MSEALGQHTLMEGNCLNRLRDVPDGSVDMAFMDLPYGITANTWDTPINLEALWALLLRVGKKNAAFVFTATQPFATTLINSRSNLFRYDLVWHKSPTRHLHARRLPLRAHESILLFGKFTAYNPQRVPLAKPYKRKHSVAGQQDANYRRSSQSKCGVTLERHYTHSYPSTVVSVSQREPQDGSHPTQKPVALLEWLIKTYSNPGDTVLDPTAGSGTTLIACENTDRRCIAIERDATYCETIRKRWANRPPVQASLQVLDIAQ